MDPVARCPAPIGTSREALSCPFGCENRPFDNDNGAVLASGSPPLPIPLLRLEDTSYWTAARPELSVEEDLDAESSIPR